MSRKFKAHLQVEALEDRQVPAVLGSVVGNLAIDLSDAVLQLPPAPVTTPPALSSNPGAAVKLYLDFDGHSQPDWQAGGAVVGRFNLDLGDPMIFSDFELAAIREIHARVSEDFAPFNIDVTTINPGDFSNGHALRVAIGDGGLKDSWSGAGGKGRVNSFTNGEPNVSWVFHGNLGPAPSARTLAEITSHEAGHGFGLEHQATFDANGNPVEEYNSNGGSSLSAPIMGVAYSPKFSRWWYGTTLSATTFQNDMAVLAGPTNGFGYRADDHGNSSATATWIDTSPALSSATYAKLPGPIFGQSGSVNVSGIIATPEDPDMFAFWSGGGSATFRVKTPMGANLDPRLEFRDSRGNFLPTTPGGFPWDPTISVTLPKSTIFMTVGSTGGYGNVGQYRVESTSFSTTGANTVAPHVLSPTTTVKTYNSSAFVLVAFDKPMNVATLIPANFKLISPSGAVLHPTSVSVVSGPYGNRYFRILVPLSKIGTYRLVVGPNVTDEHGNRLDQNGDGIQGDTFTVNIVRKRFIPDQF